MLKQFPITVTATPGGASFISTIRVEVPVDPKEGTQSEVLQYIHSDQFKTDYRVGWADLQAAGYGMEIKGGHRPIFAVAGDRTSRVIAYEQDFKHTRSI